MRDFTTYEQVMEHHKCQLRLADNYRLSLTIDDHNKFKRNWRNWVKQLIGISRNHRSQTGRQHHVELTTDRTRGTASTRSA